MLNSLAPGTWVLLGSVGAGLLNYLFALSLTAFLRPSSYSTFASGQALMLITGTVANTSVPWLLAREIARRDGAGSDGTVAFAAVLNVVAGAVIGGIAVAVALSFASSTEALWLGVSTLAFFLASTGMGWAQGHQRFRLLAFLIVAEVAIKAGAGLGLVAAGAGPSGAFAAAFLGGFVIALAMIKPMARDLRPRLAAFRSSALWSASSSMGAVQAAVTLLSVIDVLFTSVRFGASVGAARYQLSANLTRVPLFLALAFATAAFPSFARRAGDRDTLTRHATHSLSVLLPVLALLATVPPSILRLALPSGYSGTATYLPLTASISTAYGIVMLQTTVFRAAGRGAQALPFLGVGIVTAAGCMVLLAQFGVLYVGVGALAGAVTTVVVLAVQTERLWPGAQRVDPRSIGACLCVAPILVAARGSGALWTTLAAATVLLAVRNALRMPHGPLVTPALDR